MHTDKQVLRLRQLRYTDKQPLSSAAAKSNMCERSARNYLKSGLLPSESQSPRHWRTRKDPFKKVWPEVESMLHLYPKLEAKTIFEELQRRYPRRFESGQLRTLQRRLKGWKLSHGSPRAVVFEQIHFPGVLCASDFTSMNKLNITLNREPFEHLLYHFVLTYSNWEYVSLCATETFEALAEGLSGALKTLGGVPQVHKTDQLAAVKQIGKADFQRRYEQLLGHFGLTGDMTNPYSPNENGDVEQAHHRLKQAIDQALMLRGSRDFESREHYETFLQQVITQQNASRRIEEEKARLKPLPKGTWLNCSRQRVRVTRQSTIRVNHKTYSVSSRLIGHTVDVFVYSRKLEIWWGQKHLDTLTRLHGPTESHIQYRHVIDSLLRKPGAFENYRHRAHFFPSTRFRRAYDQLKHNQKGVKHYLEILHLAAYEGEERVDRILGYLLDEACPLNRAEVQALLQTELPSVTDVQIAAVNLKLYDGLLEELA
jgi:transposase